MDIEEFSRFVDTSASFHTDKGIYYAKSSEMVSYPEDGNDACYQVEDNSFWFRHRNDCIISLVKKHSENNLFFDIGGGNGFVTKGLENANIQVVLVEPGIKGAANAKLRNVSNVVCATLQDLAPLKGKLSALGAFDVIEHIEDDHSFVAEVYDIMRDDGMFYVTAPAYNFLWSDDDVKAVHFSYVYIKTWVS